jgi:Protein of unknown function (DUF2752)
VTIVATTVETESTPSGPMATVRRYINPLAISCCGAAAWFASAAKLAHSPLKCPFLFVTGKLCPGCGITRATVRFLHGDLGQAVRYNIFVPLLMLWAVYVFATPWLTPTFRSTVRTYAYRYQKVFAVIALAYWVIRNITPLNYPG